MAEATPFETIVEQFDSRYEALQHEVGAACEAEIQRIVDELAARFTRHSFDFWDSMGRQGVTISPTIFGDNVLDESALQTRLYGGDFERINPDAHAFLRERLEAITEVTYVADQYKIGLHEVQSKRKEA